MASGLCTYIVYNLLHCVQQFNCSVERRNWYNMIGSDKGSKKCLAIRLTVEQQMDRVEKSLCWQFKHSKMSNNTK